MPQTNEFSWLFLNFKVFVLFMFTFYMNFYFFSKFISFKNNFYLYYFLMIM